MNKIELRHNGLAKIEWGFFLILALIGSGFAIYCLVGVLRFWGEWRAGVYAVSALLVLPGSYIGIKGVIDLAFVWSQICIEGSVIIQTLFGRENRIDLSHPWTKSYVYFLVRTSTLRQPAYQWVEIRQNDSVIRFMPRRLIPKVSSNLLPKGLKEVWEEYDTKVGWLVLPFVDAKESRHQREGKIDA